MSAKREVDIAADAERCYHLNPEFHARVHRAVHLVRARLFEQSGRSLTLEEATLVTLGAAVALFVDETA